MVAWSPPPSLRRGWLQYQFSLAGQACHWSLNGLPWQITLHSCPPTVEIKLCPVSASFVFSSLRLFLSLVPAPPPFPLPPLVLFLELWRPLKSAQQEQAFGGRGGLWVITLGKRDEWQNNLSASISEKKSFNMYYKSNNQITMKLTCMPPQSSSSTWKHLHTHLHMHKHKHKRTSRGGPDSSQRLLDCILLHSWPLPRVLFICGWSCLCCGQSERQTLQLLQWCVNMLGMSPWARKAAGPTGCYKLMEGEESLQPGGQNMRHC